MRTLTLLATLFTAMALPARDDAAKDMERLTGSWTVERAESGGIKLLADEVKEIQLTIKADGAFSIRKGAEERTGTIKVETAKKPWSMDISIESGVDKGKTQVAIYEITQDGKLQVCVGDIEKKERPAGFDTMNKPGVTLLVFKKQ